MANREIVQRGACGKLEHGRKAAAVLAAIAIVMGVVPFTFAFAGASDVDEKPVATSEPVVENPSPENLQGESAPENDQMQGEDQQQDGEGQALISQAVAGEDDVEGAEGEDAEGEGVVDGTVEQAAVDGEDEGSTDPDGEEEAADASETPMVAQVVETCSLNVQQQGSAGYFLITYTDTDGVQQVVGANGDLVGFSSGAVKKGTTVTVTANPKMGYKFSKWTLGGTDLAGAGSTYSFTINEDTNLKAFFTSGSSTTTIYNVDLRVTPPEVGATNVDAASCLSVFGSNYRVASASWVVGESSFSDTLPGPIEAGKAYTMMVTLRTDNGYGFSQMYDNTTVSVIGATVSGGNQLNVSNYWESEDNRYSTGWAYLAVTPTSTNSHTVTFDAQGGTPVPATQTIENGGKATKPADPNRDGVTFRTWYTCPTSELTYQTLWNSSSNGGANYDFDTAVTENVTLYAGYDTYIYTRVYDVSSSAYDQGGKVKSSSAYTTTQYGAYPQAGAVTGTTVTVTAQANAGYDFIGWSTSTSTDGIVSTDSEYAFTIEKRTDLYALFCSHDSLTKVDAKAATCTEEGVEAYWECDGCGKLFSDAEHTTEIAEPVKTAALGHDWDEGKVTKEATCTEPGTKAFTCKRDATHTKTEEIGALGHDWGEWTVTKEATETEAGLKERVCKRDASHKETEVIPKIEVSYQNVDGDGAVWTKGSGETLAFTFKRSTNDAATFSHFTGIKVDGAGVTDFQAASGSVVVTLPSSYLETLDAGSHTLTAVFDDGEAAATFTVQQKAATKGASSDAASGSSTTTSAASTGDLLVSPAILALVAAVAAAVALLALRGATARPRGRHVRR